MDFASREEGELRQTNARHLAALRTGDARDGSSIRTLPLDMDWLGELSTTMNGCIALQVAASIMEQGCLQVRERVAELPPLHHVGRNSRADMLKICVAHTDCILQRAHHCSSISPKCRTLLLDRPHSK
jgi:hypothetical protein